MREAFPSFNSPNYPPSPGLIRRLWSSGGNAPYCSTSTIPSLLRQFTGAYLPCQLRNSGQVLPCACNWPWPWLTEDPRDIGVAKEIWTTISDDGILPIFGVCLGLQSLCIAYGGQLKRLKVVKHGIVSDVSHVGEDIFKDVEKVAAVRYHSLHVTMNGNHDAIQDRKSTRLNSSHVD